MPSSDTIKVAIIGAGASGLVAAKTLLHHSSGVFRCTVFERADHLGGLWPIFPNFFETKHNNTGSRVVARPDMPTNLSKYTVAFSDLAWHTPERELKHLNTLANEKIGGHGLKNHGHVGMFPQAWQVGNYLNQYSKKFVPDGTILFNSQVVRIEKSDTKAGKWLVSWSSQNSGCGNAGALEPDGKQPLQQDEMFNTSNKVISGHFDKIVVALGFFSKPQIPSIPGLRTDFPGKVIHSSQFESIDDILSENAEKLTSRGARPKIVVIGGSLSGAEVAASLALQLSDAEHSPKPQSDLKKSNLYEIVHVTSRRFWALPHFLPTNPFRKRPGEQEAADLTPNPSPTFLPLDLCFYDLSKRLPEPVKELPAIPTLERSKMLNEYFRLIVGGDQSELGDGSLSIRPEDFEKPPWVAISGDYPEFVRAGTIKVVHGRVASAGINDGGNGILCISSLISNDHHDSLLENVVGVVAATGFAPYDFQGLLPENICKALQFDPDDPFLPLVLGNHGTFHPKFPDIGFVGMYRGPYWGVMEMQSRRLAEFWASDQQGGNPPMHSDIGLQRMQELRNAKAARGQWPMGDYVGIMESFSNEMKMKRLAVSEDAGNRHDPVVPARYTLADQDENFDSDICTTIQSLSSTLYDASSGYFAARAAFRALHGTWCLSRRITSNTSSLPSGTFSGSASFNPRLPTAPGYDAEYLYIEDGTFVVSIDQQFRSTRRYVYRFSESNNEVSAWFVKVDDNKSVDYLFHPLEFIVAPSNMPPVETAGWKAKGRHLCSEDYYEADYDFQFCGISVENFGIKYSVKGPKKDYISDALYKRPSFQSCSKR